MAGSSRTGTRTSRNVRPTDRPACSASSQVIFRKIRHKNKIGTYPPPQNPKYPPPKTRNSMDMGFSCRKNAFFQAPIKLTHPFPAPDCGLKFYGHEDFSDIYFLVAFPHYGFFVSFLSDCSVLSLRQMCCKYCERWKHQEKARNPHELVRKG